MTKGELDLLHQLFLVGATVRDMAQRLGVSEKTIRDVMRKRYACVLPRRRAMRSPLRHLWGEYDRAVFEGQDMEGVREPYLPELTAEEKRISDEQCREWQCGRRSGDTVFHRPRPRSGEA